MPTIYTDLHNRGKENITVIRKPCSVEDGMTQLHVNFLNPANEYAGKFNGTLNTISGTVKNAVIDSSVIQNSVLDNVRFKNGLEIDTFGALIEALTERDEELNDKIDEEISNRLACGTRISVGLSERITNEVSALNDKISYLSTTIDDFKDDVYDTIDSMSVVIDSKISDEMSARIQADIDLENSLKDFCINSRHYALKRLNNNIYPYHLSDFTINTIKTNYPDSYVFIEKSQDKSLPIGKIENTMYKTCLDDYGNIIARQLTAFDLQLFEGTAETTELTAAGKFIFHFDTSNREINTGIEDYKLVWNTGFTLRELDIILDKNFEEFKPVHLASSIDYHDLVLVLPDKKNLIPGQFEDVSETFVINIKVNDSTHDHHICECHDLLVEIKLISPDMRNKYFYLNKQVDKIFIFKNRYTTLKFDEFQPHKFIITDLDLSELIHKTDDLKETTRLLENELAELEYAFANNIQEVSANISSILSYQLSNDANISALKEFDLYIDEKLDDNIEKLSERITTNENNISTIFDTIRNGIVYKGVVKCQVPSEEHYGTMLDVDKICHLFVWPELSYSINDYTLDTVLSTGFMYVVKAADAILTSDVKFRFNIEGLKVSVGDEIIINNPNHKPISDLTSADIDIIDDMDDNIATVEFVSEISTDIVNTLNNTIELTSYILDNKIDNVKTILDKDIANIENKVNELEISVNDISVKLSADYTEKIDDVINLVKSVSNTLSADYTEKIDDLANDVNDISVKLSADYTEKIDDLANDVNDISVKLSADYTEKIDDVLHTINVVSDELSIDYVNRDNAILKIISDISSQQSDVITSLSTETSSRFEAITELYDDLEERLTSSENDIDVIKDHIERIEYDLDDTFETNSLTCNPMLLNLVDDETNKRYTLHLISGSLVLVPNETI